MIIVPVDDVWIRVDCEDYVARELSAFFTFDIPGAQYMPAYRKKNWTGKIHLFKLRGHLLYRGLLSRLLTFAAQQGYQVTNTVPVAEPLYPDTLDAWIQAQPLPVVPRTYQVAAVRTLLDTHRGIIECAHTDCCSHDWAGGPIVGRLDQLWCRSQSYSNHSSGTHQNHIKGNNLQHLAVCI